MKIVKSVKNQIKMFRKRTLYKIEEVYEDGTIYEGYYVENSSKKKQIGQEFRWKTIKNNKVYYEDVMALDKAQYTLVNGFRY